MKKIYLLLLFAGFTALKLDAQTADSTKVDPTWKLDGSVSLNFVQSSFSNWSAGGDNSVSGTAAGLLNLICKKNKLLWENVLNSGYGQTFLKNEKRKNDDRIDFSSKLGYVASEKWNYAFLTGLKTQFDKGYMFYPVEDPNIYNSKFFAPAYLILSLGMDYKPNDDFSLYLSPVTARLTIVADDYLSDMGAFGVDPGKRVYTGFGAYLRSSYNMKLHQNILLNTSVELFSNYLDKPQNIVVNWDASIDMKVTKFISAKLQMQLMYDDKTKMIEADGTMTGPRVQFKQVLGVGFSYIF